jgi:hypothetical protein
LEREVEGMKEKIEILYTEMEKKNKGSEQKLSEVSDCVSRVLSVATQQEVVVSFQKGNYE